MALVLLQLLAQGQGKKSPMEHPTFYRAIQIDGLSIFYREAGPNDAPTLLLLHGFSSSSRLQGRQSHPAVLDPTTVREWIGAFSRASALARRSYQRCPAN
jgi:pimeloyl-ACP methyl ester carboxylesterase